MQARSQESCLLGSQSSCLEVEEEVVAASIRQTLLQHHGAGREDERHRRPSRYLFKGF